MSLANLHTAILGFSLNTKTLNRPKHTKRLWGTSITNRLGKVLSFKERKIFEMIITAIKGFGNSGMDKMDKIVNTGEKL